jgi:two-component system sensor histidine kinase EvgS
VNTSSSSLARAGVGVFSIVLGVVLLLMVGALVTADHALNSASREAASVDALESSHLIEQALSRQVAALSSLRGALMMASIDRDRALQQLATELAREAPSLRELRVADSSGRLLYPSSTSGQPAMASRLVPTVTIDANKNVVLDVPLALNGRSLGGVVARFEAIGLLRDALSSVPETRVRLLLVAGADTIIVNNWRHGDVSLTWHDADVRAYGTVWQLHVAHAQRSQALRITLWTLGLVAVVVFGAGVLRERRQALRIAERSSELERLSSELLRANRMKSEFLANVSHELRTPLNAIVGFVDLLRDGVYGDLSPRQAPPVERIAASATHLRHLVDQVLDIAKIAAGRLEVHAETILLRPFVLNVVSELEPLITERGLNLSIAVGASLPRVRTDPTHLRQILVNLIGNAVKYTPVGGIAIRARLTGLPPAAGAVRATPSEDPALLSRSPDRRRTWIALQVIDTGIGISPSDQERIFDEFEQVNAGPRGDSMERGTGLGLAISRRLVRLLGGEISVESQPGKGSTFTIWLPVSPADIQAEPPTATAATQQAAV